MALATASHLRKTFLICTFLVSLSNGGQAKWPVAINNIEIKNFYHCLYIYFICTDYLGKWPENRQSCVSYYNRCESLIQQQANLNEHKLDDIANDVNGNGGLPLGEENGDDDTEGGEGEGIEVSSCKELRESENISKSGEYVLVIGSVRKTVYCDMENDGGGWTVIQRRGDFGNQANYFLRNWTDYRQGFGNPTQEYWLGLEAMHLLSKGKNLQMRITMEDFENNRTSLVVNNFTVGTEGEGFKISYKNYNSKLGNSLPARGTKFSTVDRDNDAWSSSCAKRFSGAWWYSACHNSNLNGLNLKGEHESFGNGINWYHFRGFHYSLKSTELKVRAKDVIANDNSVTVATTAAAAAVAPDTTTTTTSATTS